MNNEELQRRAALWEQGYWEVPDGLDTTGFNFEWRPYMYDRPYIHQFGTQHQRSGGPRFVIPENEGVKFQESQRATMLPNRDKFTVINDDRYVIDFDWSWHPDDYEPPLIYVWGNQHLTAAEMATVEYHVAGAEDKKYMTDTYATLSSNSELWHIKHLINKNSFDFSWTPHPWEPPMIYVWGNQFLTAEEMSTVEYVVPGATEYKYMGDQYAKLVNDPQCWKVNAKIDEYSFDFSWVPHPHEPPYIYAWGNQFLSAEEMPTIEYHVPGATEYKYMLDSRAKLVGDHECWQVRHPINKSSFDFSWVPHPWDPPMIYVWGNQFLSAAEMPTVEYVVPGATEYKYMDDQRAQLSNNPSYWKVNARIDESNFDWSWTPHPHDPPYIYAWGNQFLTAEEMPTVEYVVPGATEYKYIDDHRVKLVNDPLCWNVHHSINKSSFDFSWVPHPWDPPLNYIWGNQFLSAEEMPTVEYAVPGATEYKYMGDQRAQLVNNPEYWAVNHDVQNNFDWTWTPHPHDPPYIYAWGNQFLTAEEMPTVEYRMPGATEYKYMDNAHATLANNPLCWQIRHPINKSSFDFDWVPHPWDPPMIYVWGNQFLCASEMPTVEYVVPGATEYKYMNDQCARIVNNPDYWQILHPINKETFDFSWVPHPHDPPYIYAWGNQFLNAEEMRTVEYVVPGATEYKYMSNQYPLLVNNPDYWQIRHPINKSSFDFSWVPHPHDPPYIYAWGNQFLSAEEMPTVEYVVPGATEYKYMDDQKATLTNNPQYWEIIHPIHKSSFDFSWVPHPHDPPYIYVWGNQFLNAEEMPTVLYKIPGATEYKYMDDQRSKLMNDPGCWHIIHSINKESFDWDWMPHPWDPPMIYVWGNQFLSAEEMPTVEYVVPGATEYKYINENPPRITNNPEYWQIRHPINKDTFDFSWVPHPHDPPYIYAWGNQFLGAEEMPTVEYVVPGATEYKYMDDQSVKLSNNPQCWEVIHSIVKKSFDFTWVPHPHEPPYIYAWGNQFLSAEEMPTVLYKVPGATEYKYMDDQRAKLASNPDCWEIVYPIMKKSFDWDWVPHPHDPPYIYVWGNEWNDAATEPTVLYRVPGATEYKYIDDVKPKLKPDMALWSIPNRDDLTVFDFSWRPNPHSPPQIYQWENNGPIYRVPGATEVVLMSRDIAKLTTPYVPELEEVEEIPESREESSEEVDLTQHNTYDGPVPRYYVDTTLEALIEQHPNEVFWALNKDLKYDHFNFNWKPNDSNFRHINVFGSALSKDTQTYYVNATLYLLGYREINYVEDEVMKVDTKLSMFYIDVGGDTGGERFEALKLRYPQLIKTRFLNSWADTIKRCLSKSETRYIWVLSSENDYSKFEFNFYPGIWQRKYIHVFGTQWSHWGNTYFINTETFAEDTKYVKIIEHLKNINHVRSLRVPLASCNHDIIYIDHGNSGSDEMYEKLSTIGRKTYRVPYAGSYLESIKKWIDGMDAATITGKNYRVWVTSSVCDYSNFDFTWRSDPFEARQLHVFASEFNRVKQKFGDTMFISVPEMIEFINSSEKSLEEYTYRVNYISYLPAQRQQHPVIAHNHSSQVDAISEIKNETFDWPYVELQSPGLIKAKPAVPSLWSSDHRSVIVNSVGATNIYVPTTALNKIEKEVYDYPLIYKDEKPEQSQKLDIVFISNGEPIAEENYQILVESLQKRNVINRVVRVKDVNGRIASQHAAANVSESDWYFLVNGKIRINDTFDWNWQPDRLQEKKHYIFTVTNPVNGLEYGHQAIVANNRVLTLKTVQPKGLDFTLASPREVVEMSCGVAIYNTDPWTTWRTAFREAVKLRNNIDAQSQVRLKSWTTIGNGEHGEWSIRGALDGVEFWRSVEGDMTELLKSYEWAWLKQLFESKYQGKY